jgi:glucose-6-phosphate dehydrogenase-like protein
MPPDAGDANLSLPPDQARPLAAAPPDPGEEGTLKATRILHERGQSLWLDNITRGLLDSGQIQHYIDNYAVTGLTSSGRRPWCCAPPRALLYGAGQGLPPPNRIRLRLQPDAGVTFALLAKPPGGRDVATEIPVSVDFRTALGAAEQPYERILADALAGDPAHSARMDNVEEAWRIVGPALDLGTEPPRVRWGAGDQRRLTRCRASAAGSHSQTRRITGHHQCQSDVSAPPGISWQAAAAGTARGRRGHDQGRPVPGVPHPRPPRRRSRDKEQR